MALRIHKEGKWVIPIAVIIMALLIAGGFWIHPIFGYVLLLAGLILFGFILNFFRDPSISSQVQSGELVAPCDGKLVVAEQMMDKVYFKDERLQLSIYMSPLDVHVNRSPMDAEVIEVNYFPGKFLVAFNPKSSQLNEQTYIVLKAGDKYLALKQIAGFVARRIRYYIKAGDELKAGEELGFIRFGSRVDLVLPKDAEVLVPLGTHIKGGKDIIARW